MTDNIHPADELAAIREEIKILESRADQLKAYFLEEDRVSDDFTGKTTRVQVVASTRETIDRAAIIAELGREVVDPFIKKTSVRSVRVSDL